MDNFVAELKNNINIDPNTGRDKKNHRIREILYYISTSSPEICITEKCGEDGDVKFEIPMKTLGISNDILVKYKTDICSEFMANFIGELLIRENINRFAEVLTNIDPDMYSNLVDRFEHRRFGMDIVRDKFTFIFHISLLQNILLEDVKRKVR